MYEEGTALYIYMYIYKREAQENTANNPAKQLYPYDILSLWFSYKLLFLRSFRDFVPCLGLYIYRQVREPFHERGIPNTEAG